MDHQPASIRVLAPSRPFRRGLGSVAAAPSLGWHGPFRT